MPGMLEISDSPWTVHFTCSNAKLAQNATEKKFSNDITQVRLIVQLTSGPGLQAL